MNRDKYKIPIAGFLAAMMTYSSAGSGAPPMGFVLRELGAVTGQLAYLPERREDPAAPSGDGVPEAPDMRYAFCIDYAKDAVRLSGRHVSTAEPLPPTTSTVAQIVDVSTKPGALNLAADDFPKEPSTRDADDPKDRLHTAYQLAVWAASDDIMSPQARTALSYRFGGHYYSAAHTDEIIESAAKILEAAGLSRAAYDETTAAFHDAQGWRHYEAGAYEFAEAEFRTATSIDPSYANAHFNLGNVLGLQGKKEAAAEAFLAYVRLRGDDNEGWASLARVADPETVRLAREERDRAPELVAVASAR